MFGWFKKKASPQVQPAVVEQNLLQYALSEMLVGHGLDVQTHDGWLFPRGELPGLRATHYITTQKNDNHTMMRLDFELLLDSERIIVESYAGWGDNEKEAMGQGVYKFCTGAFHVFLSAFWEQHEPDQVEIESWTIAGAQWNAFISNLICNSTDGQNAELPAGYMNGVQTAVSDLQLTGNEHWISIYFASLKGEVTCEVRLDNKLDQGLTGNITAMDWPIMNGFYSKRMFIFLRKIDEVRQASAAHP